MSGEEDCINCELVNESLVDEVLNLVEDLRVVQDEGNGPRPEIVPEEGMPSEGVSEEEDP